VTDSDEGLPRYYSNLVNVATGAYDVTLTFLDFDMTNIEPIEGAPFTYSQPPDIRPQCQIVMSLGHAKSLVPMLVKAIADYETKHGEIPAPGFDQLSKG
jgi:hypothetical protein